MLRTRDDVRNRMMLRELDGVGDGCAAAGLAFGGLLAMCLALAYHGPKVIAGGGEVRPAKFTAAISSGAALAVAPALVCWWIGRNRW